MKPKSEWPGSYCELMGVDGGMFRIPFEGRVLMCIVSFGMGWDHVSVSLPNRCPNWPEMCHVKKLFWNEDETVVQYHPKKEHYINNHRFCLHMWRPQNEVMPTPDPLMVGL